MKRLNKLGFVSDFICLVMFFSAFPYYRLSCANLFLTFHFDKLYSSAIIYIAIGNKRSGVAPPIIIDRYFMIHCSEQSKRKE